MVIRSDLIETNNEMLHHDTSKKKTFAQILICKLFILQGHNKLARFNANIDFVILV